MILFESDWAKFPKAMVHLTTRNRSAVRLALKLKKMGIKNHAFFLALHNPLLENVDPYDPDLSAEQMFMIGVECRVNPWYFFREVARAPARSGTVAEFVEFNRSNICLWWCFLQHITITLTQPRQTGKSFCADLLMTWLMNFGCNATQINLLTLNEKLRGENIKRLKDVYDELPPYLNYKTRDDANNTEELSVLRFNNTYKTHVPQPSEKRAYNLGRGMSTGIFQVDEPPFQTNIEISLPAALAAMGAAIDAAKRNNAHYGIIYTTTAGKKDDKDGRYFYSVIQESAVWSERYLDMPDVKSLREVIIKASRSNRQAQLRGKGDDAFDGNFQVYAVFSHLQLGKTDDWLLEVLKRTRARGDDANRDFFNVWTSGTQTSPLPAWLIEKMATSSVESDHQSISNIGAYTLRWFIPENEIDEFMRTRQVIMGIDPSDAGGGDDIGMVLTDAKTGGVVAAGNVNETNLILFCKWLVALFVKYDNLVSIIERRSSGAIILDYLMMFLPEHGIDPFRRLFNWVVNDPSEHPARYATAQVQPNRRSDTEVTACKKHFGFSTSGSGQTARSELFSSVLKTACERFATRIHDVHLINQILGLETRNGRVDHAAGEHDDLVVAWLLTHWMLTRAKNLSFYGIDSKNILVPVFDTNKTVSKEQYVDDYTQQLVRNRIDELLALMKAEEEEVILNKYERELHLLETRLVLKDGEQFSLDAVLQELAQSRKKKNYGKHRESASVLNQMPVVGEYIIDRSGTAYVVQ